MITLITSQSAGIDITKYAYALLIGFAVLTIAFYLLRSIGIYTLAKRRAIKGAGIAFVPFIWIYIACKIIANKRFFNWTFSKIAVIFTIIFSLSQVLLVVYNFFVYFPLAYNLILGNNIYIVQEGATIVSNCVPFWLEGSGIYVDGKAFIYPYADVYGLIKVLDVLYHVTLVLDLICTVISVILYVNLFRTYAPGQYIVYTVLSFFGLFAIFAFVIRKREQITYEEYIRSRYGYNPYNPYQYGANQGPNGNPNVNQSQRNRQNQQSPFSEFNEEDKNAPFSEFDEKEKSPFSDFDSDDEK